MKNSPCETFTSFFFNKCFVTMLLITPRLFLRILCCFQNLIARPPDSCQLRRFSQIFSEQGSRRLLERNQIHRAKKKVYKKCPLSNQIYIFARISYQKSLSHVFHVEILVDLTIEYMCIVEYTFINLYTGFQPECPFWFFTTAFPKSNYSSESKSQHSTKQLNHI